MFQKQHKVSFTGYGRVLTKSNYRRQRNRDMYYQIGVLLPAATWLKINSTVLKLCLV